MGDCHASVFPCKQKTDNQNQKKPILVLWPLHVGLYHAIRQPVKFELAKKFSGSGSASSCPAGSKTGQNACKLSVW